VTGTLEEARAGMTKLQNELARLTQEFTVSNVGIPAHSQIFLFLFTHPFIHSLFLGHICQSREETSGRTCDAHLFDNKLKELECVTKEKKHAVSGVDPQLNMICSH
jgi:hypothetical protein